MGFTLSLQATLGGQTRDGKDAVNELSFVFLDAEEQVGLKEPDFGCRIFDDTDPKFIRRVGEVIKLGRGKPKFFFDNVMLDCMNTGYPDMPIEDLREYISTGCTESFIPFVTMCDSFCAIMNVPKIVELTIHNGRDAITGEFIGLETGNVRTFKSIGQFKTASNSNIGLNMHADRLRFKWMHRTIFRSARIHRPFWKVQLKKDEIFVKEAAGIQLSQFGSRGSLRQQMQ